MRPVYGHVTFKPIANDGPTMVSNAMVGRESSIKTKALLMVMELYAALVNHEYFGLHSRSKAKAYVQEKHGVPTTWTGRFTQERRIWEIMGISVAIILTLFVVGILFANIPETGEESFDTATTNVSVEIAENLELAPLVILIIIVVMVVAYVMVVRQGI